MGLRSLLLIVIVALLVWLVRRLLMTNRPAGKSAPPPSDSPPMVRCDHCGLHVPADEAVCGPEGNFCCEDHRRAGRTEQ